MNLFKTFATVGGLKYGVGANFFGVIAYIGFLVFVGYSFFTGQTMCYAWSVTKTDNPFLYWMTMIICTIAAIYFGIGIISYLK
jgi:hypothetical protein